MHVILIAMGSAGDVHPFVGLGLGLRARGHRVTIQANPHFRPLIERLGFEAIDLGTVEEFHETLRDPDLWHPVRAFDLVSRAVVEGLPRVFDGIASRYVPGETVVAASSLAFGARVAQEALGVPLASVHLQPSFFRSHTDTPIYAGMHWLRASPGFVKTAMFGLMDRVILDRKLGPGVNAFRARFGLPPASGLFAEWVHSPQMVLGLWPDWFAPIQADWPARVVLTGFPLFDEADVDPPPQDLEAFLQAGSPPIVFAPGSANIHAGDFFAESLATCRLMGRRGVLVTRFPEQVPDRLPSEVKHFPYVPFSRILPRAAALVHHGGIGTMAQAMASGVPQLVRPLAHDQFDNAARAERLGVARTLVPKSYRARRAARVLSALLDDPAPSDRCHEVASWFAGADPIGRACDAIERLAPEANRPADATSVTPSPSPTA